MNMTNVRCLVVGGDGLIGSQLVEKLRSRGADVIATTRRKGGDDEHSRWLDLVADPDLSRLNQRDMAFLCAGVTNIALCEADPQMSYRVNVTNTLAIAKRLYALGIRIVFFSSNAVFDGQARKPEEDTAPCPSTEYGRQKVATEQGLMALSGGTGSVVIVRLSKVLTPASGIIAEFMKRLAAHESCPALVDLRISPISLSYATNSILEIALSPYLGIFHLSGTEEMTYEELARRLAVSMAVSKELVQPLSSGETKVNTVFRPEHPALGMKRTGELLGIEPEGSDYLLRQLVAGIRL